MHMDSGELIDRYTITRLYRERDTGNIVEEARFNAGVHELRKAHPDIPWDDLIALMYQINGFVWDFESPIHTGKLDCDPVIAGVLALRVRKLNAMRTGLSKLIDRLVAGK